MSRKKPMWSPWKLRSGNVRKMSFAEGRVLRSWIWHLPFKPKTVGSNTSLGARPFERAMPSLPNATPRGTCCCASCKFPSNSNTQLLSIFCWTKLLVNSMSYSALCQLVKGANNGGSPKSALSEAGKKLLSGISWWKPVPIPAISDGNREWSGSLISRFKQLKVAKHLGWCERTVQSGKKPASRKNVSRSCRNGAKMSSLDWMVSLRLLRDQTVVAKGLSYGE